jgi:hypothetical protein
MKFLMLLSVLCLLSACGDAMYNGGMASNGNPNACTGVDTSQAPTSTIRNPNGTVTYFWGNCSITY